MGQLTSEQHAFIIEAYARTNSFRTVQNEFRERFPDRNIPSKSTILRNVQLFLLILGFRVDPLDCFKKKKLTYHHQEMTL